LDKIGALLQAEFGRHQELADSGRLAEYEKTYFAKIINGVASEVELTSSLEKLSQMLTKHYGKEPVFAPSSTDCNIPLSLGIPAATIGLCLGDGEHTREEWIYTESLKPGFAIAADLVSERFMR